MSINRLSAFLGSASSVAGSSLKQLSIHIDKALYVDFDIIELRADRARNGFISDVRGIRMPSRDGGHVERRHTKTSGKDFHHLCAGAREYEVCQTCTMQGDDVGSGQELGHLGCHRESRERHALVAKFAQSVRKFWLVYDPPSRRIAARYIQPLATTRRGRT